LGESFEFKGFTLEFIVFAIRTGISSYTKGGIVSEKDRGAAGVVFMAYFDHLSHPTT
jgi:hypothetical protein